MECITEEGKRKFKKLKKVNHIFVTKVLKKRL